MSRSNPTFSREQIEYLYRVFGEGITLNPSKAVLGIEHIYYDAGIRAVIKVIEQNEGHNLPMRPRH